MSEGPHADLEPFTCACGYRMDAATASGPDDVRPSDGDISMCLNCTAFLLFERRPSGLLGLRRATGAELAALHADTRAELRRMAHVHRLARKAGRIPDSVRH